jgi:hypothetical protein
MFDHLTCFNLLKIIKKKYETLNKSEFIGTVSVPIGNVIKKIQKVEDEKEFQG